MLTQQCTKICDLTNLTEMMGGNKEMIKEITDAFLAQIPGELTALNEAISNIDYYAINRHAHSIKSTVSIVGIDVLPLLTQMEELGAGESGIEIIRDLQVRLRLICTQAIEEIENSS